MHYTTLVTLALALAPLALATPSPPQVAHPVARDLVRAHHQKLSHRSHRGLPRRQKRWTGAEATVKCIGAYLWALCDGENCTDMGSVAAGTKCENGAMTWDDGEVAASSAAPTTSSSKSEEPTVVANIVESRSKSSSSTSSRTPRTRPSSHTTTTTSSPAYVAPTTSSTTEEWTSTSAYVAPTTTTTTSVYVAPTTTTTPYVEPTTSTSVYVEPTTSAPASGANSGGGEVFSGSRTTYYNPGGNYGACGTIIYDSDYIVALSLERYGTGSNNAPDCGRSIKVTNEANSQSVTVKVADACPGCPYNGLDLSESAFLAIADLATGVVATSWEFLD